MHALAQAAGVRAFQLFVGGRHVRQCDVHVRIGHLGARVSGLGQPLQVVRRQLDGVFVAVGQRVEVLPLKLRLHRVHVQTEQRAGRQPERVPVALNLHGRAEKLPAALLGAEEFGFATAALIVEGCVMMRACQKNTCPQGIATQDPELRARFKGKPEHVVNFFMFIAEEVRELLAQLGFRTLEEAVGHVECLDQDEAIKRWKSDGIDLSNVLMQPGPVPGTILHKTIDQNHELDKALDNKLIELAQPALDKKEPVRIEMPIRNVYRTLGTMLGYEITKRYGEEGLPDDTIGMTFHGAGGQSIGAFIPRGETIRVYGEVNDYAGKGLSGGRMVVRPEDGITFDPHENVIAGNVTGFGATSGQMFVAGRAGERFAVRNGGATFVVEGVGDHGC